MRTITEMQSAYKGRITVRLYSTRVCSRTTYHIQVRKGLLVVRHSSTGDIDKALQLYDDFSKQYLN